MLAQKTRSRKEEIDERSVGLSATKRCDTPLGPTTGYDRAWSCQVLFLFAVKEIDERKAFDDSDNVDVASSYLTLTSVRV